MKKSPKLSKDGLPKREQDWSIDDWRDLHKGIRRIKARIAARYKKRIDTQPQP